LTAELGTSSSGTQDAREALSAAIEAKMTAKKITYSDAYQLVKDEAPELFKAYAEYKSGKPKGE
jgi:hypothetical protein